MFDKTLKENADETFQMAEKALKKIIDGEVTYQNLRNYVINLHNSYELYFKYRLLENDVYKLFQDQNYVKKNFKDKKELLEYVKAPKVELPKTVSFRSSINRLKSLDMKGEFNEYFENDLIELHKLRNKLTHFRYKLGDEELKAVNELFIKYSREYSEHRWGSLPWEEKIDLKEFEEELKSKEIGDKKLEYWILKSEFNEKILKKLECNTKEYKIKKFKFDCKSVAENLVTHGEEFSRDEFEKIEKRLEVLKYVGFIEFIEEQIEKNEGEFWNKTDVEVKTDKIKSIKSTF